MVFGMSNIFKKILMQYSLAKNDLFLQTKYISALTSPQRLISCQKTIVLINQPFHISRLKDGGVFILTSVGFLFL